MSAVLRNHAPVFNVHQPRGPCRAPVGLSTLSSQIGHILQQPRRNLPTRCVARRTLDPEELAVTVDGGDALCLPCDRDIRNEFFLMGCARLLVPVRAPLGVDGHRA